MYKSVVIKRVFGITFTNTKKKTLPTNRVWVEWQLSNIVWWCDRKPKYLTKQCLSVPKELQYLSAWLSKVIISYQRDNKCMTYINVMIDIGNHPP